MATINITVQSLLNTAVYDSYAVDDAGTIGELKDSIESNTDCSVNWFDLVFDNEVLNTANTIASYGIIEDSQLRTHNKIARLANRELRQVAKLNLAALDRLASSNPRSIYDITQLPTQYDNNTIVDNPNSDGDGGILLVEGRPWIAEIPSPSYTVEFRDIEGGFPESPFPKDVITTVNEGDEITFVLYGTNIPEDPDAYLQFSGASITAQDGGWFVGPSGLFDETLSAGGFSGDIQSPPGSPFGLVGINADNLTEGNETLRLDWYVLGEIVASANLTIVDTSLDPVLQTLVYSSVGSTTWTAPAGVTSVDYLVVGGGGGGANGYDRGGGGGGAAGMMLTGTLSVTPGESYTVTVGNGGTGGADARANNSGTTGGDSSFSIVTALGGIGGQASRVYTPTAQNTGGAAQISDTTLAQPGGGGGGGGSGGGGGGASGAGGNGSGTTGGAGGAGLSSDITGTLVTYSVGGAGGGYDTDIDGANGTDNRGNGGAAGGATPASSAKGGNGGTGIVVLSYLE
jgi:hypothetical protein